MRILLSAYGCEPHKGSEQGVGWNWAEQVARYHDVWVITRQNNRTAIEAYLRAKPIKSLNFSYIDLPTWITFWKRGDRGLYLYYLLWQIMCYFRARKLHRILVFDICHHVSFGTNWLPTFLWLLRIPFVWGPIGGFESIPKVFRDEYSWKWKLYESLREWIQFWIRFDPISKWTRNRSAMIITRTRTGSEKLSKYYKGNSITLLETGIDPNQLLIHNRIKEKKEMLSIIMVGRLIHWKGFSLGIRAFAKAVKSEPNIRLEIIGTGPEEDNLRKLCNKMKLDSKVTFSGVIPHTEVLKRLCEADIFLFPSLKDAGAWVIFEAMAAGLPLVSFDYAGPGEILNQQCAIKIMPTTPQEAVNGFADALLLLCKDDRLRNKLGAGALDRLMEFRWAIKGEIISDIYKNILLKF